MEASRFSKMQSSSESIESEFLDCKINNFIVIGNFRHRKTDSLYKILGRTRWPSKSEYLQISEHLIPENGSISGG